MIQRKHHGPIPSPPSHMCPFYSEGGLERGWASSPRRNAMSRLRMHRTDQQHHSGVPPSHRLLTAPAYPGSSPILQHLVSDPPDEANETLSEIGNSQHPIHSMMMERSMEHNAKVSVSQSWFRVIIISNSPAEPMREKRYRA